MAKFRKGLEGVIALETSISSIDGKKGILKYRGYKIKDIAKHSSFEETAYLLWYGKLPNKKQLDKFTKKLRSQRKIDSKELNILKTCSRKVSAMDALRTTVSYMAHCDPDINKNDIEANIRKGIRLSAKMPTIVAAHWRIRQGKKPIQPKEKLSHGANFLYMLKGKLPTKEEEKAIELDQVLIAEHEINASTFATRVAVSTLSDLHSAVVSGISTLNGPLHGGARGEIYKIIEKIKQPKNSKKFVMDKIKKKQVVMGFGHRVYKTYDPRAKIMKKVSRELAEAKGNTKWHNIIIEMEKVMMKEIVEKKGKPIYPNVDLWSASIYKYLKIPKELSTSLFALGRITGWIAHINEQFSDNRLIRPRAKYVGETTKEYILIQKRK